MKVHNYTYLNNMIFIASVTECFNGWDPGKDTKLSWGEKTRGNLHESKEGGFNHKLSKWYLNGYPVSIL